YGHPEGISAVSLEIVDGGTLADVTIARLRVTGTRSPVFIRLADRGRAHVSGAPRPGLGTIQGVHLHDIDVTDAGSIGCSITGLPDALVRDVTLERIHITHAPHAHLSTVPPLPPELAQTY